MSIDGEKDLEALRKIGKIVANCLKTMGDSIEPGMTTAELDAIGEAFLKKHGARSAPQLTYQFPGATCISVNGDVAHGIPGATKIRAGDLINIDVSAELGGYFGDTGGSFMVPPIDKMKQKICVATRQALNHAIQEARAGRPLNVIGKAIEEIAKKHKMTIIENLGSHGVGRALHEEPGFIPSFYDPNDRRKLKEGQVITIEPFLSNGAREVIEQEDGWTLSTPKPFFAAQYEHTIVITKGAPMIMTIPG
jgi:methionyl aminopeptidase